MCSPFKPCQPQGLSFRLHLNGSTRGFPPLPLPSINEREAARLFTATASLILLTGLFSLLPFQRGARGPFLPPFFFPSSPPSPSFPNFSSSQRCAAEVLLCNDLTRPHAAEPGPNYKPLFKSGLRLGSEIGAVGILTSSCRRRGIQQRRRGAACWRRDVQGGEVHAPDPGDALGKGFQRWGCWCATSVPGMALAKPVYPSQAGWICVWGHHGCVTPPLPPGITQPWGGSVVLWLEQARTILLLTLKVALGLVPWVAQSFPGCWGVTFPPPFLIPAVGRRFFGQSAAKWLCGLPRLAFIQHCCG